MHATADAGRSLFDSILVAVANLFGVTGAVAGPVLAASENLNTGLVVSGGGLLAVGIRYWYQSTKRTDNARWEIADEYRIERDYYRLEAEHWRGRWGNLVRGLPEMQDVPILPNLDTMKAEARDQQEGRTRARSRFR